MKPILCCALLLAVVGLSRAQGQDCCDHCARCGCSASCCKVCRSVDSVKKVTKITYSCECEDFCVPGPSDRCVACDECGRRQIVYTPTCAQVRTRTKLVKHETVTEVPTQKWVVEPLCNACASRCNCASAQAASPASDSLAQDETDNVTRTSFHAASRAAGDESDTPSEKSDAAVPGFKAEMRRMLLPLFGQK